MKMINKGRKMVITLIAIVILIDIATIISVSTLYALSGNMDMASFKIMQGIFRFILTGAMLFFLYKGHRWAKWLSVVLFMLAGIVALLQMFMLLSLLLFAMGMVYVTFGLMLILSKSINDFLRYQRDVANPMIEVSFDNQGKE